MKRKIVFALTLFIMAIVMFATASQKTYALETENNELDPATVTAVNDSSGTVMGVRITDNSFVGKNLLIGIDLPDFIDQNDFYIGYDYNSSLIYKNTGKSSATTTYTSLMNYNDDNSVEFQLYWDSGDAYYEIVMYELNELDEYVSALPTSLTIENITDWLYIQSAAESEALKYPYAYVQYRDITYLNNYEDYSDMYSSAIQNDRFYDNLREQIETSSLYFNIPITDTFQPSKSENLHELYYEIGFNSDNVTRVYKNVDLEDGSYPTLVYDDVEYLPGSYINVDGWDVNSYSGNVVDDINTIVSFSHESEDPLIGMNIRLLDYENDTWYETVGTYPIIVSQSDGENSFGWTLFVNLTDSNQAPVIDGPTELEFLTGDFNVDLLYDQFTITDDSEGEVTLSLKDTSTLQETDNTTGSYTAIIVATDENGAHSEQTVSVDLVDQITENTIVVSGSLLSQVVDNWMSIAASAVIILVIILFATKFRGKKKIKKSYKRR